MPKSLSEWILELKERFDKEELGKDVVRAKITIGFSDQVTAEVQYHALEYTAKKNTQSQITMKEKAVKAGADAVIHCKFDIEQITLQERGGGKPRRSPEDSSICYRNCSKIYLGCWTESEELKQQKEVKKKKHAVR